MEDVLKYFIRSYFMEQLLYRITVCLHLYSTYYRRKTINYGTVNYFHCVSVFIVYNFV